ncbi:ABC transporter ATP-binding protein [Hansschlegelia zhihuaiae]|uniref:ABC transporter ATP-binding protein n=1 Tax=Hansschlegelia zhihuaiae TaxID=405005 RepID=A0A4V1KJV9_9HYPH|nr:ABC transporter ATP-binding protein [Hansschlegelia zhihuaiae]RXF75552.1 ABC transporter ATP-binding protein [Hansschlegelia zhihuaiae]
MTTTAAKPTAVTAPVDHAAGKSRVELKNVSRGFGEDWAREEVVRNLTFEIKPGDLTCIVGPSGCGKSTIVNMVAGYDHPDSGEILLNGQKVVGPAKDRMVVFQETALMPWQTTFDNVVFGPRLRHEGSRPEIEKEAHRLLEKVGLGEFKQKYPSQLSGGMQRRAELARALINRPLLLIMDEPFRGLDAMSRPLMQEFFLRLFEENRRTNLFVTSEIEEAIFLADRLVVLSNRPAQVRAVIEIPLPRPRQFHMMSSPEVFEIKRQALEILHDEAMKSFGGAAHFAHRGPAEHEARA